jgi:cytoskeletal protein CcmA (bactofilin family)
MADITVTGNESYFNEDASFFKDVYVYGILHYDFKKSGLGIFESIDPNGITTFNGPVYFKNNIYVAGISSLSGAVFINNDLEVSGISTFKGPVLINNDLEVSGISTFNGKSIFNSSLFVNNDLEVNGISTFNGPVLINNNLGVNGISTFNDLSYFYDTVDMTDLYVNNVNTRQRLNVGTNGSVFNADVSTGKVGIGSTAPEQKLDIIGNVRISQQIYDSLNSPGVIGAFLTKDAQGIKWTVFQPSFIEGIFVYNDGILAGIESFRGLNLKTGRSLGVGIDPIQAFENPDNPKIADIYVYDYWDYSGDGTSIYRNTKVGINNSSPGADLDVTGTVNISGTLDVSGRTILDNTLDVYGGTILHSSLRVDDSTELNNTLDVYGGTILHSSLRVDNATELNNTLDVDGNTVLHSALRVDGSTELNNTLDVDGATTLNNTLDVDGSTTLNNTLDVDGSTTLNNTLDVDGNTILRSTLEVVGLTTLRNTLKLDSSISDVNNNTASGKFDYRLSSVGTGVSWRPPGVQTQNAIWVTIDGNDSNSGYLEGDAKRTIGAAASIAEPGDTIFVRSGVYYENNPIGLRTDVSVSGQELRLVTIIPLNREADVFHVRRGCLIENLSFAGDNVAIAYTGSGAIAFPPTLSDINAGKSFAAVSGYLDPGPATEGPSGRWRSPYIRNCTNFMTKSIGMKINGDHATASTIGNDLKCMVCDSFTQYNENGIGVSITNNGYAQLVSIFTINSHIGIYCDSGGSCDLTNSNSSFGNYGLYAVGLGRTEYTAKVDRYPSFRSTPGVDASSDIVTFKNMFDEDNNPRRPYDGQACFFKIDLNNYPDADKTGLQNTILQEPMLEIKEIVVTNGGSNYSPFAPPVVYVRDSFDLTQQPKGPQGIIAELSPNIDEETGALISIDVVNSGRNYLPTQNLEVFIDGGTATAEVITTPIYYSVSEATQVTSTGITTVTFNQFIPYELFGDEDVSLKRISRILTSSHSFEYIGTGVDINTSTPFQGALPIKENEIVYLDGAQIPFTSTDQRGNFDIGEGFQINQPSATIRGRDFTKAIQAEVTPIVIALR